MPWCRRRLCCRGRFLQRAWTPGPRGSPPGSGCFPCSRCCAHCARRRDPRPATAVTMASGQTARHTRISAVSTHLCGQGQRRRRLAGSTWQLPSSDRTTEGPYVQSARGARVQLWAQGHGDVDCCGNNDVGRRPTRRAYVRSAWHRPLCAQNGDIHLLGRKFPRPGGGPDGPYGRSARRSPKPVRSRQWRPSTAGGGTTVARRRARPARTCRSVAASVTPVRSRPMAPSTAGGGTRVVRRQARRGHTCRSARVMNTPVRSRPPAAWTAGGSISTARRRTRRGRTWRWPQARITRVRSRPPARSTAGGSTTTARRPTRRDSTRAPR